MGMNEHTSEWVTVGCETEKCGTVYEKDGSP